jgi:L-ascorbate metabolism protein UlaG (beta-lactamase superfamily)
LKGGMMDFLKKCLGRLICFFLLSFLLLGACGAGIGTSTGKIRVNSDHFDGDRYFNPDLTSDSRKESGWGFWRGLRWITMIDWPEWPTFVEFPPGPPPEARVPKGTLRITSIGHSTFLIQMDGLNILTDPIWSDRCSPVSWAGPKRHSGPGLALEDLPPIDAVLVSHNHYDHLDLPTLKKLARKNTPRALTPLGNEILVRESGIPAVDELDWWRSARLSSDLTVTLVPAQHFSSRTLWDRNRALWGGFVLSGPSGNVYFSGDTGYGPHFREIARRFSPIRAALLPISPFRPKPSNPPSTGHHLPLHMGPGEAVQAHLDLGAGTSVAAHFQVFQLGADKFDDAVEGLAQALREGNLKPDTFLVLNPGQGKDWPTP